MTGAKQDAHTASAPADTSIDQTEDDEEVELSADTLRILAEFQDERAAQVRRFEELKEVAESQHAESYTMDLFDEDWNASQFWYTDKTADLLAKQLLNGADSHSAIAVVSAPSVFVALKRACHDQRIAPRVMLLEYDKRFEVFGQEYQFYDFQAPLQLPANLKARFDRIICDPPFLSQDCQAKTALTTRFLARHWSKELRFISCTGERMETLVHRLYKQIGIVTTAFEPQ